jgi:hypothetical protein
MLLSSSFSAPSAPALSFLSPAQQEALLLSAFDGADLSVFPFLNMSPKEQYMAGCQYCWDICGNLFKWSDFPEVTGYVNPTPVAKSSPKKKAKSGMFQKVVNLLNTRLF